MKMMLNISVLTSLLVAASSPCLAMTQIADISKERAKELGMGIRSNVSGPDEFRVWLAFKTEGELTSFSHVELEITSGERRLVSARLLADRPSPESVVVNFTADPANLARSTLTVVVQPSERTRIGYRPKVKDSVELEQSG